MKTKLNLTLAALLLTAAGPPPTIFPTKPPTAQFSPWYPGPTLNNRNYSPGTSITETGPNGLGGNPVINIPHQGFGETQAVMMMRTVRFARTLHLKYKVETDSTIEPNPPLYMQAKIVPFIQKQNDDWSCAGRFISFRWYATKYAQVIRVGTYTMDVPLSGGGWTDCQGHSSANGNSAWLFSNAKFNTTTVGLAMGALGGPTGVIRGVQGLGTYTKITILEWSIN